MATITVKGEHATATIIDLDSDEGTMTFDCSAGSWCPRQNDHGPDYSYETHADVINAAEIHVDLIEHPGHQA